MARLSYAHTAVSALGLCCMISCSVPAGEGKALPEGAWAEHGFSPDQLSELRDAIHDGIEEKAVPGCALMIIHKGEVIFREAHGRSWPSLRQSVGL